MKRRKTKRPAVLPFPAAGPEFTSEPVPVPAAGAGVSVVFHKGGPGLPLPFAPGWTMVLVFNPISASTSAR